MNKYLFPNEYFCRNGCPFLQGTYLQGIKEYLGAFDTINSQKLDLYSVSWHCSSVPGKRQYVTFLCADGHNRAHELQAFTAVGTHGPSRTLHPGAGLKVYGVQGDHLG